MYNFGRETEELQTFLLYSKYPDGLMLEHFSETLFRESIRLRNFIVAEEMKLGESIMSNLARFALMKEVEKVKEAHQWQCKGPDTRMPPLECIIIMVALVGRHEGATESNSTQENSAVTFSAYHFY